MPHRRSRVACGGPVTRLMQDHLPADLDWSRVALFLDFDGTVAPIVSRPEDARMSRETQRAIGRIAQRTGGAVAFISGRALGDLDLRTSPLVLPASGSHGVEIRSVHGDVQALPSALQTLQQPAATMRGFAQTHELLIEEKPGAATLHYRSCPALAAEAVALVDALASQQPALRALHGHMVSEIALAGVDKGTALRHFMEAPPFAGRTPVMAGDDTTDEDAILAAQDLGGHGIRIGDKPSAARFRATDIDAFLTWLDRVAETAASD